MIFITGAARSGTTLTTSIIEACGGNLGNKVSSLKEHMGVKDEIIKEELRRNGCDPMGQHPLPDGEIQVDNMRERVLKELGDADTVKDAKIALMWQAFHKAFPEAQWVIVRRSKAQIVDSCKRARFMKKAPNWEVWVEEHERRFKAMRRKVKYFEVWPDKMVRDGDYSEMADLIDWLGLEWDGYAVKKLVDPNQWH